MTRQTDMNAMRQHLALGDPRHGQILALGLLIALGHWAYAFEMPAWRPLTALGVACATQAGLALALGWRVDLRSAAITSLSLTLLLRTDGPELVALATVLAVGSKAVLRVDGRHFVNPAAFAIGIVTLAFPGAWISPGQWGTAGLLVIAATATGLAVTYGARRLEVPLLFLAAWGLLSVGRALWLGDPMSIALHQMSSGALVVFAFFMISDPMTAPWNPWARMVWVGAVAATGFALQHLWIVDAGPIFGLLAVAWTTPILNRLAPARAMTWRSHSPKGALECAQPRTAPHASSPQPPSSSCPAPRLPSAASSSPRATPPSSTKPRRW